MLPWATIPGALFAMVCSSTRTTVLALESTRVPTSVPHVYDSPRTQTTPGHKKPLEWPVQNSFPDGVERVGNGWIRGSMLLQSAGY